MIRNRAFSTAIATYTVMINARKKRPAILTTILLCILLLIVIVAHSGEITASAEQNALSPEFYLPLINGAWVCPKSSTNSYAAGPAFQYDRDNPVRPAGEHADKNLTLRGYTIISGGGLQSRLVDYGSDDPNQPPQFATLVKPARVPELISLYRIGQWKWAPSPDPGSRTSPISQPKVTALGLKVNPGETIYVPSSGYNIGGGMEVLVLYADETSVTLRYTREDSAASPGYTVFVDHICTDPNLLELYRKTDSSSGPRYKYTQPEKRPYSYDLPNLPSGKVLGTAIRDEVVVAISDSGRFWDPRSCNEWWQIRPGYSADCPDPE